MMLKIIGTGIRQHRYEAEMTFEELARSSGLHLNTVWAIEHGRVDSLLDTAYRAFSALEISLVALASNRLQLNHSVDLPELAEAPGVPFSHSGV